MRKLITASTVLTLAACAAQPTLASCNYGSNGGYNSPSCHREMEERVTELEGQVDEQLCKENIPVQQALVPTSETITQWLLK